MTKKEPVGKKERSILLVEGQAPQFSGEWRVGEILQMLNSGIQWIHSLPFGTPPETELEQVE